MLDVLSITSLIFGGCCTNVYTLEKVLATSASSGLLITFVQFAATAALSYPSQFSSSGRLLKASPIPLREWALIASLHFATNMLNNWAFAFNISVPVHIVLRSFGSVTTMLAGILRGKRYSTLQMTSVGILTAGVLISAVADAESKGKSVSLESSSASGGPEFAQGLAVLLIAQFLAAYMGAHLEHTYETYGSDWAGNLFYSHFLSLPLFLPLSIQLRRQLAMLAATSPTDGFCQRVVMHPETQALAVEPTFPPALFPLEACLAVEGVPKGLLYLAGNAVTQLACISGVNLLSAKSSAVTVTIVLSVRKLVSFILSTVLFGHHLSVKMATGAALVFGSGALYGYETSWRLPQQRKAAAEASARGKEEKMAVDANGNGKTAIPNGGSIGKEKVKGPR